MPEKSSAQSPEGIDASETWAEGATASPKAPLRRFHRPRLREALRGRYLRRTRGDAPQPDEAAAAGAARGVRPRDAEAVAARGAPRPAPDEAVAGHDARSAPDGDARGHDSRWAFRRARCHAPARSAAAPEAQAPYELRPALQGPFLRGRRAERREWFRRARRKRDPRPEAC